MMITGKSYIGKELSGKGSVHYRTFNSNEEKENHWDIVEVVKEEIDSALIKAKQAFLSLGKITQERRSAFLREIANQIDEHRNELYEVYMAESSLPRSRAEAELNRTINQLELFAEHIASDNYPETVRHSGVNDLKKTYLPLGPIAVFGSSNFPFAYSTIGGDSASALAAGCPVIVKAHPMHAGTGELVAKYVLIAAEKTGMPDGIFSNLNIRSHELGAYLVQHPEVKGVGFTGSLTGGRALFELAQKREVPIPFFAEMGSLNPVCIHPSALLNTDLIQNWAKAFARSISDGAGQFCTKPGLLFAIKGSALESFKMLLTEELERCGHHSMLHPELYNGFMNKLTEASQAGGNQVRMFEQNTSASSVPSFLLSCTSEQFLSNKDLRHEMFGPAAIVVECQDLTDMNNAIAVLDGQLTGTMLYSDTIDPGLRIIFETIKERVGRVIVNGVPTGVEVCEAMHHGGPYPATTDSRFTAVGTNAIRRWLRPIVYQNVPEELLPDELK